MAEANVNQPGSSTITETTDSSAASGPRVVLKLRKPKTDKQVQWKKGTVDNEFMNKKKSKCCCIYEKPRLFGESSSEDSDDDDGCSPHCRGHKKKCYHQMPPDGGAGPSGSEGGAGHHDPAPTGAS